MKCKIFSFLSAIALLSSSEIVGYNQPLSLNLGQTNWMDGMPLPGYGFAFQEYLSIYQADRWTDSRGLPIGGVPGPLFRPWVSLNQFLYQTDWTLPTGAQIGYDFIVPYVLAAHLETPNLLNFTTSGRGFGDIYTGPWLQWQPMDLWGHTFAHRIEFAFIAPTGKYHANRTINPSTHVWAFNPYWAGTFFLTKNWEFSWRMHYLTSWKNHKTGIRAGDAFHTNYSFSWKINDPLATYVGVAGYYFNQFQDSKLHGRHIPASKEKIFAIGPILSVVFTEGTALNVAAYVETWDRNRPEFSYFLFRISHYFGEFGRNNCCQ